MKVNRKLRNIVDITWSSKLAYTIGLIASDGCLSSSTKAISFVSKDSEMVNLFLKGTGISKKPYRTGRGGEVEKRYYAAQFKSKQFHSFLQNIGITPAKSRTIQAVEIPDIYFSDFFRGLYDGDGTFWTWWDKRWPNSFVFHIEMASASKKFLEWLQKRLKDLYGTRGHIKKGAGVHLLRFSKGDTRLLTQLMYQNKGGFYLPRKYIRIKSALDLDRKIKQNTSTPR